MVQSNPDSAIGPDRPCEPWKLSSWQACGTQSETFPQGCRVAFAELGGNLVEHCGTLVKQEGAVASIHIHVRVLAAHLSGKLARGQREQDPSAARLPAPDAAIEDQSLPRARRALPIANAASWSPWNPKPTK